MIMIKGINISDFIKSFSTSKKYFEHQQHPEFTELRGRDIEQQKSYFVTRCNTGQWEEARLSVKVKMEPGKLILCFSLLLEGVLMKYIQIIIILHRANGSTL